MKKFLIMACAIVLSISCVHIGRVYGQVNDVPSLLCDESYAVTSQ